MVVGGRGGVVSMDLVRRPIDGCAYIYLSSLAGIASSKVIPSVEYEESQSARSSPQLRKGPVNDRSEFTDMIARILKSTHPLEPG